MNEGIFFLFFFSFFALFATGLKFVGIYVSCLNDAVTRVAREIDLLRKGCKFCLHVVVPSQAGPDC